MSCSGDDHPEDADDEVKTDPLSRETFAEGGEASGTTTTTTTTRVVVDASGGLPVVGAVLFEESIPPLHKTKPPACPAQEEDDDDDDDDDEVPSAPVETFPLEMDFYQAALHFATTDEPVNSAVFRALSSFESRARASARQSRAAVSRQLTRRGSSSWRRRRQKTTEDAPKRGGDAADAEAPAPPTETSQDTNGEPSLRRQRQRQNENYAKTLANAIPENEEDAEKKEETQRQSRAGAWYARHRMLAFVSVIVILQTSLLHQLLFSVENRSCSRSTDCVRGTSCSFFQRETHHRNLCTACEALEDGNQTRKLESACFELFDSREDLARFARNDAEDVVIYYDGSLKSTGGNKAVYSPRVFIEVCAGCVEDDGRYVTLAQAGRRTIHSMRLGDFVALAVCATAVALAVVGEVREAKVAVLAQKRRFRESGHRSVGHVWFAVLTALRAYLLVPQVVATIPSLVLREGGNAVQLIFNTVAVVFVVEVDNLLGVRLLSAPTLARLAEQGAVVEAPAEDHKHISKFQKGYFLGIIGVIFLSIYAMLFVKDIALVITMVLAYLAEATEVFRFSDLPHLTRVIVASGLCPCCEWPCCFACCCCYYCCCLWCCFGGSSSRCRCCCCCCDKKDQDHRSKKQRRRDRRMSCLMCERFCRRRRETSTPSSLREETEEAKEAPLALELEAADENDDHARDDRPRDDRPRDDRPPPRLASVPTRRVPRRFGVPGAVSTLFKDLWWFSFEFVAVTVIPVTILNYALQSVFS